MSWIEFYRSRDITEGRVEQVDVQIDPADSERLVVVSASADELKQHEKWLELLRKESENGAVWDKLKSVGGD